MAITPPASMKFTQLCKIMCCVHIEKLEKTRSRSTFL